MDLKLSYSSATLLRGCEQRFYNYKKEIPKDSDYEDNIDALVIGTSFHHVLEMSKHQKPEKISELLDHCVNEFKLPEEKVGLVHAMVLKYLRLHKQSGLECVACEIEVSNEFILGYVDAILIDPNTKEWFIVDLKTCARFYQGLLPKLKRDVQLNLYATFKEDIAKKLDLDIDKFGGCRYRTTTKSVAKQKKTEGYTDYVLRMAKVIKSYDIVIPKEELDPEAILKRHKEDWKLGIEILGGEKEPVKNFSYCDSFFRACPYWSNCHGSNHSEATKGLKIYDL